jgi:hypothetical protein
MFVMVVHVLFGVLGSLIDAVIVFPSSGVWLVQLGIPLARRGGFLQLVSKREQPHNNTALDEMKVFCFKAAWHMCYY